MQTATFTESDARRAERRYGIAYLVSTDGRALLPARYIGPDRTATIRLTPGTDATWPILNYRITDGEGRTILHGGEQIPPSSVRAHLRATLKMVQWECPVRVFPAIDARQ